MFLRGSTCPACYFGAFPHRSLVVHSTSSDRTGGSPEAAAAQVRPPSPLSHTSPAYVPAATTSGVERLKASALKIVAASDGCSAVTRVHVWPRSVER